MPISIDIYGTIEDANEYFATRLYEDWSGQPESKQFAALLAATRAVDLLARYGLLAGYKTVTSQDLEFPRNGDTEVPQDLLFAVFEEAAERLRGRDPAIELEQTKVNSEQTGGRGASFDRNSKAFVGLQHGFVSITAWQYLAQFLESQATFDITRS
jgi:hypothetical protein